MATYVPNAMDPTQPTGDKKVASAPPEFRAIKVLLDTTVQLLADNIIDISNFQSQLTALQAAIGAGTNSVALAANLSNTIDELLGDYLLGVKKIATNAVATTQHEVNNRSLSVCDYLSAGQIMDAYLRINSLDCTVAIQKAVTDAFTSHRDLDVPYKFKITTINIDRPESSTYDEYFNIRSNNGGGFYSVSASPMFSTTLPFTAAPIVSLIKFIGIYFESSSNAINNFVLDNAKYLRTAFESCNFSKIRCLAAPVVYTQSIYFSNCNMRRWTGVFFDSPIGAYDLKVHQCIMEAGVEGWNLGAASGCSFTNNNIEGLTTGAAIRSANSQALLISGNYFESNNVDLVLNVGVQEGVVICGNKLVASTGTYGIFWGTALNCTSFGNYCVLSTGLHNMQVDSHVSINDYSSTILSSIPQYYKQPYNYPTIKASATANQGPFASSTFVKALFTQEDWDTNSNFTSSTFTPNVEGYYQYNTTIRVTGTNMSQIIIVAYKNGAAYKRLYDAQFATPISTPLMISSGDCIPLNGSTDTLEIYVWVNGTTPSLAFTSSSITSSLSVNFLRNIN